MAGRKAAPLDAHRFDFLTKRERRHEASSAVAEAHDHHRHAQRPAPWKPRLRSRQLRFQYRRRLPRRRLRAAFKYYIEVGQAQHPVLQPRWPVRHFVNQRHSLCLDRVARKGARRPHGSWRRQGLFAQGAAILLGKCVPTRHAVEHAAQCSAAPCGGGGIRTPGRHSLQWFSRPPRSTTPAPLRYRPERAAAPQVC